MNWKNRLTNYNFWVSIVSAVILILRALRIDFDFIYINEVVTAILGLLVVIGIINDPTKSSSKQKTETEKENAKTDESTQNFLENAKNEAEIEKNDENLSQNDENFEIVEEKTETQQENLNENNEITKSENCLPSEQENETAGNIIQTDLSVNTLEDKEIKNEVVSNANSNFFNIVN